MKQAESSYKATKLPAQSKKEASTEQLQQRKLDTVTE